MRFGDAAVPECHASTICALPDGGLLVACFSGTHEGRPDTAIWMARYDRSSWSPRWKVVDEGVIQHWNPVLQHVGGGTVNLYYKIGRSVPEWHTRIVTSFDGGASWSEPRDLVPGDASPRGPLRNPIVELSDGSWLAPSSVESRDWSRWDAFVDISTDAGATWTASGLIDVDRDRVTGKGVIQPAVWESEPGRVHMLLRSTCGRICRSDSTDYGRSWSTIEPTSLPNNNSGIGLVRLATGELLLAYNPVGSDWGLRTPLVVDVSTDNGESWRRHVVLEDEEPPADFRELVPHPVGIDVDNRVEFSYPAIIETDAGVQVTYTWKRAEIIHARIPRPGAGSLSR